jgi:hypothetical protein
MASKTPSKSFPFVLYQLLQDSESKGNESIVSWLPHGKAFRVNNTKKFVNDILPRYFSQSKITSFQRQLNLYCFSRIKFGKEKGAYHHPYFLRDEPQLIERIIRMPLKGSKNNICDKNSNKGINKNLEESLEQGIKTSAERITGPKRDHCVTSDFCQLPRSTKQQNGCCQHRETKKSVESPSVAHAYSHDDDLLSFCTSDW